MRQVSNFIPAETEKIWSRFSAIRFFLSWLPGYIFPAVHFLSQNLGAYTYTFFVLTPDDAKKCTAITAHIHWKCAVISVYFFASGKARLPKTAALYGWLALCLCLSDIRGHFGNCVLRRSGRSLKKEGISTPLHLPCNQERCPSFGRSSLCLYCAALFINGRSRVKTSCLRQPLTRPVLSVLVELVSVAMFPIPGSLCTL